jgi:hypothetical protein
MAASPALTADAPPSLLRTVWQSVWPLLIGIALALVLHFGLPKVVNAYRVRIGSWRLGATPPG